MSNLFEDIQRLILPSGTPRRVLYQGPPGFPTGTFYKVVGEVAVVHNPPTFVEPREGSRPRSFRKAPKRTRSSHARSKSIGFDRSGRGQSPIRRTSKRSWTKNRSQTPVSRQTPKRETTSGKGKSRARESSPSFLEFMMLEAAPTTSKASSIREPLLPVCSCPPEPQTKNDPAQTPTSRRNPISKTPGDKTLRAEETGNSEDEVAPSPNMRGGSHPLAEGGISGASSLSSGLDASYKEKATPKNPGPLSIGKTT